MIVKVEYSVGLSAELDFFAYKVEIKIEQTAELESIIDQSSLAP